MATDGERIELVSPEDESVDGVDREADMVGRAVEHDVEGVSAEEAAVHIVDEAPGGSDDHDPGYVDER